MQKTNLFLHLFNTHIECLLRASKVRVQSFTLPRVSLFTCHVVYPFLTECSLWSPGERVQLKAVPQS